MVLGVCRRILTHAQDAEDAFQATFLVLARKAGAVVPREMVGNWLYGVAYRTALKAKASATRRRAIERQVTPMPETPTQPIDVWNDVQPLLDRELQRLPDRYRVPLLLCDLEGRSRKEVAGQLGIPEGTLSSRLATARKRLARRLAGRGLAITAGTLALALSQGARAACVPSSLVSATAKAALSFATGDATAGLISAKVALLAHEALKTLLPVRLNVMIAVVLALGLVGAGTGMVVCRTPDASSEQGEVVCFEPSPPVVAPMNQPLPDPVSEVPPSRKIQARDKHEHEDESDDKDEDEHGQKDRKGKESDGGRKNKGHKSKGDH
jgi:RNA polymerase sigma-70 factor (ECF subfamily)